MINVPSFLAPYLTLVSWAVPGRDYNEETGEEGFRGLGKKRLSAKLLLNTLQSK